MKQIIVLRKYRGFEIFLHLEGAGYRAQRVEPFRGPVIGQWRPTHEDCAAQAEREIDDIYRLENIVIGNQIDAFLAGARP